MRLSEFQTVRIKTLLREDGAYDPLGDNESAPRIGDTGIVVDVRATSGGQPEYTVESGRPDGTCVWIADFVEEELEAVEPEAISPDTEGDFGRPNSRSVRHHHGAATHESAQSGPRRYVTAGAAVLSFFALAVTVATGLFFGLFILWPPDSAAGAGFRAATVGMVFTAVGSLWADESIGDALITATIVGLVFLVLGAVGWHAWAAD